MDLVEIVKEVKKYFAVVDTKERFAGIIELNDIKQRLFQPEQFEKVQVRTIMKNLRPFYYTLKICTPLWKNLI